MGVLSKIFTALRGGAREVGESIIDANSIRILEQEIRDAEDHMAKAKQDLTSVMAKEMQANRELERMKKEMTEYEGYATEALEKGNEDLALEIAEKISGLEVEVSSKEEARDTFAGHSKRLKELVKKTERQLSEYKRQLTMVKTTESVQKATSAITDNFSSSKSKLVSATESLERIKKRQADFDDRLKAGEQLASEESGSSLDEKMRNAGIGKTAASANSVLDRIKSKKRGSAH